MVDAVVLDERLAIGFSEKTQWKTSVVTKKNAHEVRNAGWSLPRRAYELPYAPLPIASVQALVAFFNAERGQQRTWLLRSFFDCVVTAELAGTGDGSDTTFQIVKSYGTVNPYSRTIKHVKAGTLSATVNGVAAAITSETLGLVTLTVAPANGHAVRFTCEFYVPVRFSTDEINVVSILPAGSNAEAAHALIEGLTAIEVRT